MYIAFSSLIQSSWDAFTHVFSKPSKGAVVTATIFSISLPIFLLSRTQCCSRRLNRRVIKRLLLSTGVLKRVKPKFSVSDTQIWEEIANAKNRRYNPEASVTYESLEIGEPDIAPKIRDAVFTRSGDGISLLEHYFKHCADKTMRNGAAIIPSTFPRRTVVKYPSLQVVELGSGKGHNTQHCLLRGANCLAVDLMEENIDGLIQSVSQHHFKGTLRHLCGDITQLSFAREFETKHLVICLSVLNYLPPKALQDTLIKIYDLLLPGGHFIGSLWFQNQKMQSDPSKPYICSGFSGAKYVTGDLKAPEVIGATYLPSEEHATRALESLGFRIVHSVKDLFCLGFVCQKL